MRIHQIISLIDKTNAQLAVLLCHHNADPDAVCAAFAFSQLLKKLRPNMSVEIAAAQGPSRLSKHLMNFIPVKLATNPRINAADLVAVLDTNTIQQLDEWAEMVKKSRAPIVVIDHHASHPDTERLATVYIADESASSTCELVYNFFKEAKVELTEVEAKALFLGIAFDTRHFVLASSTTFKIAANLIGSGVNAQEALSLLSLPMDPSERVAHLKAGQRMKLLKIGRWLVTFSHVSAYQASAARALIELGADLAMVASQKGDTLSISLRSSRDFYEKTGIHLGRDIANPLGEHVHGMGGGHTTSAGVNGMGDVESSFKHCIRLLEEKLK